MDLKDIIRNIPDFPKPGVVFRDITPLLANPQLFAYAVDRLAAFTQQNESDVVLAAEARGYLFGAAVAYKLGLPLVIVRKPGKLPHKTVSHTYELEYGTDTLEIHEDAIRKGQRVMLVDDLLATGGTIEACAKLVEKLGGVVAGCAFVIELSFLKGREKLTDYAVFSIIDYESE
ncbi:MAG: adenine phosphoribosyltransferase [Planctomycetes bacterium DG_58]|nr:MAG: adenine phosphoribosyltransferase [Planctomycetes bacterium DG_58]KPK99404.1 MAG: adenine phosphoribosyltransferase [Planctomycetes bacterium SM23_65]